jgi:ribose-phosphate pyrophosphokinase
MRLYEPALRGRWTIASCRAGAEMGDRLVQHIRSQRADRGIDDDLLYLESVDAQFSDSETIVRLEQDVNGTDVYLIQALLDPISGQSVDHHYMAFLIAVRAFREWGANHVTGILPYLAYARQDKSSEHAREPTTANLMADLSIAAGLDRLVTWHPHSPQLQGFYNTIPIVKLESLALFAEVFGRFQNREDVILVAPDAGASKLVTRLARALHLNAAIASKYRPRPEEASIQEVIGDFTGKRVAIIVDDMISSGGTVYALIKELVLRKGIEVVHLGASHNLCMEVARERLQELVEKYGLREIVVTNSIPQTKAFQELPGFQVRDISAVLSQVILQIHHNLPVGGLFYDRREAFEP